MIETWSLIPVIVRLCNSVDGVVGVSDHLPFRVVDVGDTPLAA
ncbi:hypothetical protein [Streptomyces sp. B8F3]